MRERYIGVVWVDPHRTIDANWTRVREHAGRRMLSRLLHTALFLLYYTKLSSEVNTWRSSLRTHTCQVPWRAPDLHRDLQRGCDADEGGFAEGATNKGDTDG